MRVRKNFAPGVVSLSAAPLKVVQPESFGGLEPRAGARLLARDVLRLHTAKALVNTDDNALTVARELTFGARPLASLSKPLRSLRVAAACATTRGAADTPA